MVTADRNFGYVYTSVDSGQTWVRRTGSGPRSWIAVTSSANGSYLAAIISGSGSIYVSTDSGNTWTPQTALGQNSWVSLASSADGYRLAAVDGSTDDVYTGVYRYTTTPAATGSLQGGQYDAVELQYIGAGSFLVLSFTADSGSLVAY